MESPESNPRCDTLGKLLNLFGPQFSHRDNNSTFFIGMLQELNELMNEHLSTWHVTISQKDWFSLSLSWLEKRSSTITGTFNLTPIN